MQPDAAQTIVVVDADPLVADVLMHALRRALGPAVCAVTTDHAAELLAMARWRLAVVDVMLPGRSSVEIAAIAVAMETPVLLTTGDFSATAKLRRHGFAVLQKPMAMHVLIAEARRAIAESWGCRRTFTLAAARMLEAEGRLRC